MNAEHIKAESRKQKAEINNALDMLQIITEDVEANFIEPHINNTITARANLTLSSLSVVSAYLRHICEGVSA